MQNLELHFLEAPLVLDVRDFRVEEAMNKPFQAFLTVRSKEPLDLSELVARKARFKAAISRTDDGVSFAIGAGHTASWSGIVAHMEEFGAERTGVYLYRVHLVHALWVLGQNKNYRVFQHLSELDIARVLLTEWSIPDNVRLDAARYKKRDYRIQYGESDLDFLHRNLEDLGISYYLEDAGGQEVVTFSAAPEKNEPRPTPLRFYDEPPPFDRAPWVTGVSVRRALRAAKFTLQDVDYRFPPERQPRISKELETSTIEKSLENYEYNPGIFCVENAPSGDTPVADRRLPTRTDDKYGQWLTDVRLQSIQSTRYRIHFETNAFDLHPGVVATIEDHPRPELTGPVLIIGSTLTGSDTGAWNMACVAHPVAVPFVPELVTPRPCASGIETATVVGLPGKKIDPQEIGSVLVQFHWDREGMRDERASCWVPVSYGLAGPGRGMFSLPRIGEEVLVDFLAGDLDKPMVTGRVYTGLNRPWTKDVNKMGDFSIKNDSLDDPSQHTGIHMTADAKPLMHMFTTHDKQLTVGNDERCKVTANRSRNVGGAEDVTVGGVRSVTSGSQMTLMAGSKEPSDIDLSGTKDAVLTGGEAVKITASTKDMELKALEANITQSAKIIKLSAEERIVLEVGGSKLVLTKEFAILQGAPNTYVNPGADQAAKAAQSGFPPVTAAEEEAMKQEFFEYDRDQKTDNLWDPAGAKKQKELLEKRTKNRSDAINKALDKEFPRISNGGGQTQPSDPVAWKAKKDKLESLYPPARSPYWDRDVSQMPTPQIID